MISNPYGTGARSKFWGVSGSEDRGGGDNSIQFINIGREYDKSFKEWRRKIGGWKSILTFLCYWLDKKCHFKKLHFGQFFLFVFLIHRLLYWFESFVV